MSPLLVLHALGVAGLNSFHNNGAPGSNHHLPPARPLRIRCLHASPGRPAPGEPGGHLFWAFARNFTVHVWLAELEIHGLCQPEPPDCATLLHGPTA